MYTEIFYLTVKQKMLIAYIAKTLTIDICSCLLVRGGGGV